MVEVIFNPDEITYARLCEEFWVMHDPTSLNQQGGDIGTQYRSSIYFTSLEQGEVAMATRNKYQSALDGEGIGAICTEILNSEGVVFYPAEEYHQRYLEKNPNGYDCHSSTGVSFPKS
jgi:peptide-methionine (S)-S-oxide reductase